MKRSFSNYDDEQKNNYQYDNLSNQIEKKQNIIQQHIIYNFNEWSTISSKSYLQRPLNPEEIQTLNNKFIGRVPNFSKIIEPCPGCMHGFTNCCYNNGSYMYTRCEVCALSKNCKCQQKILVTL